MTPQSIEFTNKVLDKFNLTLEQLYESRYRPLPQIRQMLYHFLHKEFKEPYLTIGRYFNQHHATVIHGYKQAEFVKNYENDKYHYIYEKMFNVLNNSEIYSAILCVKFELNQRRNDYKNQAIKR